MQTLLACPHCCQSVEIATEFLGLPATCPGCHTVFPSRPSGFSPRIGELPAVPRPVVTQRVAPPRSSPAPPPRLSPALVNRTLGQRTARVGFLWGIVGTTVGAVLGAICSQFWPPFDVWLVLAAPFSPARLQGLPKHVLILGLAGGLVTGGLASLLYYMHTPPGPSE